MTAHEKIEKVTNLAAWQHGEVKDHFPCDVGEDGSVQSNGSKEYIMELDGKSYSVITDWDDNVRWPDLEAAEIQEEENNG
jgi:hypothetical protein